MNNHAFVLIFLLCGFTAFAQTENAAPADDGRRSAGDSFMKDIPLAPKEYRRPDGYTPVPYEYDLHTLSEKHSDAMMARAAAEMARIDAVNANGPFKANGPSLDAHSCPEWFQDAKFGIFIDWGLWSIASWCPQRANKRMYPDWYELRMYSNFNPESPYYRYRDYHVKNWGRDFQRDDFIELFKARTFDAGSLCRLFKDCGARYVVPFSKHHSGFCLWDSSWTFRDVVDRGPHRDIDAELVEACRGNGLKFGFYFSVGEWEYPVLRPNGLSILKEFSSVVQHSSDVEGKASGKVAVNDYVRDYSVPQAVEFIDKYDPDLIWYDYDWVNYATNLGTYDISAYFYNKNAGKKEVCVNDRYGNGTAEEIAGHFTKKPRKWLRTVRGDFYTDELGDTREYVDPSKYHPWECCRGISMTFGNHWGDCDSNVMSRNEFICEFADIISCGGNLLFVINLDPQGSIPEIQRKRLLEIGEWLDMYGEAVYGTRVLAPFSTPDIDYVQSKDGSAVYAIVKKPSQELEIECAVPAGAKAVIVGSEKRVALYRRGGRTFVRLPRNYVIDASPLAVRIQ